MTIITDDRSYLGSKQFLPICNWLSVAVWTIGFHDKLTSGCVGD